VRNVQTELAGLNCYAAKPPSDRFDKPTQTAVAAFVARTRFAGPDDRLTPELLKALHNHAEGDVCPPPNVAAIPPPTNNQPTPAPPNPQSKSPPHPPIPEKEGKQPPRPKPPESFRSAGPPPPRHVAPQSAAPSSKSAAPAPHPAAAPGSIFIPN